MTASNKLIDFDKSLREQFSKEFQSLYTKTNDIKQTDKDFCWSKWKPFNGNQLVYIPSILIIYIK